MRLILFAFLLISFMSLVNAQKKSGGVYLNDWQTGHSQDSSQIIASNKNKKWVFSKYLSISTSTGFYNGGNATVFAAPIGLLVTHNLNRNLYAFGAISATPAYVSFNHSFITPNTINKFNAANNLYSSNNFNLYPKAELGLMYINDQKTFSISGSISIEKGNYSFAPINQFGFISPNTINSVKR